MNYLSLADTFVRDAPRDAPRRWTYLCSLEYFGNVSAGGTSIEVPVDHPLGNFTHLAIFTQSVVASVSSVAFPDEDLDAAEIGGQIQWVATAAKRERVMLMLVFAVAARELDAVEPQSTGSDRVEFYNLYLAEHPTGQSRSLLFDVAKGLSSVPLAANSALVDYQALLIYTISRLAEQTTPAYTLLSDTISIPTNLPLAQTSGVKGHETGPRQLLGTLSFPDLDLDFDDVGGTLVWLEPDDTDFVTSYFVYMALPLEEAVDLGLCQGRPLLGSGAPQIFGSFTLSVVGASAQQDLDLDHLGGTLSWRPPHLTERISVYVIYLAENAFGIRRSQLGPELPKEATSQEVPPDTLRLSFNHFTIFTKSTLAEQTTPAALAFFDEFAMAANMSFIDEDLDESEIGGNLTWYPPADTSEVSDYLVYLAEDQAGRNRSLVGVVEVGTHDFAVPPDTPLLSFTHLTIFARSELVEQTTPMALPIVDSVSSVSNASFTDLDLDAGDLGGTLEWSLPSSDIELVESYYVYFAASDTGYGRKLVSVVDPSAALQEILGDTKIESFKHLLVYTKSPLVEQTTPASVAISDSAVTALNLSFSDFDLDQEDLGGNLTWTESEDLQHVDVYRVYMAIAEDTSDNGTDPALGAGSGLEIVERVLFAAIPVGTTELVVPLETPLASNSSRFFTHFLIYGQSSLAEQSTPASLLIEDLAASASAVNFTDEDLDEGELGGNVTWVEPEEDWGRLQWYRLYLQDPDGLTRRQVEEDIAAGQSSAGIFAETKQDGFSHLAVYTVSMLAEQTTPASLAILDTVARPSNLTFFDLDLDLGHLGGNLTWQEPADMSQVTHYVAYFAEVLSENAARPVAHGCQEPFPGADVMAPLAGGDSFPNLVIWGMEGDSVRGAGECGDFVFDLDGASEAQVEEAARQALASTLDVVTWRNQFRVWCHVQSCGFEAGELGQLIITVTSLRRLEEELGEARRLSAQRWEVSYIAVVPVELASDAWT
eukprot:s2503_g5.t1